MKTFFLSLILLVIINSTAFSITDSQMGAMGIIEPQSRVLTITNSGSMEPVTVEKIFITEGQSVKANQPLMQLSNHSSKQAILEQSQANVAILKNKILENQILQTFTNREWLRNKNIKSQAAISVTLRDEAEKNWRLSVAQGEVLKSELSFAMAKVQEDEANLKNSTIYAPFDGVILDILSRQGERAADRGLLSFASLKQMDVRAEIFESDMPSIKIGQRAEIIIPQQKQILHGTVYHLGFVVRGNDVNDTDPLADKDNRVVSVRIKIDDDAKSLQNQIYRRVTVRILP